MPGLYAGALAASDVRVTAGDGTFCDCLQKITRVAGNAVLGFSGRVDFGFSARDSLIGCVRRLSPTENRLDQTTLDKWQRGLSEMFRRFETDLTRRSRLMVLWTEPDSSPVMVRDGADQPLRPATNPAFLRFRRLPSFGCIYASPDFAPTAMPPEEATSIGSGSGIAEWSEELASLQEFDLFRAAVDMPVMLMLIPTFEAMERRRLDDVSRAVQIFYLGRDDIVEWKASNVPSTLVDNFGDLVKCMSPSSSAVAMA